MTLKASRPSHCYLFQLCAWLTDGTVERRSPWVSDDWLAAEINRDCRLDRLVALPEAFVKNGITHPLPYE